MKNWMVIGNRGGWWNCQNWGDIGMSPASQETTLMNMPKKHYTKTGGHNITSSLKIKRKYTQWVVKCHHRGPSLTRDT